ncbi:MAG: chemotaxis protein CheC [Desulfuromonadaceae bacterium]|nr:chemotaxis protein CheC [Desulfuromonadaceae bacterium]
MVFQSLTDQQLDALKEVSNIGMGHAATAMSQLIGQTIYLKVPHVTVTDISAVPEILGGPERLVVGISLQILGGARGDILLVFPTDSVNRLLTILLGDAHRGSELDDIATSTLKEVGNILASAYLNALGSVLGLTLIPSVPALAYDMAGAIADHVLIELSQEGDYALMVETVFHGTQHTPDAITGHFFLLPDPGSMAVILRVVGNPL